MTQWLACLMYKPDNLKLDPQNRVFKKSREMLCAKSRQSRVCMLNSAAFQGDRNWRQENPQKSSDQLAYSMQSWISQALLNNVEHVPIVALSPISTCYGVCMLPKYTVWGRGREGEILNLKVFQTSEFIIHIDSLGYCRASNGLRFFRANRLERSAASWATLGGARP